MNIWLETRASCHLLFALFFLFRVQMVQMAQLVLLALKEDQADLEVKDHGGPEDRLYVN